MKKLEEITPEDIENMSYNELVGITKETNRPPGGVNTVKTICKEGFLNSNSHILEIGTSTGFTAIELARLTGARVTAIDINQMSLDEALIKSREAGVKRVTFELNDAMNLSYGNSVFDMVFCGNVTSYIPDRVKALHEYERVLKDSGFLAAVPMLYLREPPKELIEKVSQAIKYKVVPEYGKDWASFFKRHPFVLHFSEDYKFDDVSPSRIREFTQNILFGNHLKAMRRDTLEVLRNKYTSQIELFAENLSYMGYKIMLLRKEKFRFDDQLFFGSKIVNGDS